MSRSLQGFIAEHQNSAHQLYLKLEQRFTENHLIRDQWNAMAHDVSLQIGSLKAFPRSSWNQIKADAADLEERNGGKSKAQTIDISDITSLQRSFETVLDLEEPIIHSIYTPLIRSLRKNWTDAALDFYIMVKAHIVRIVRIMESFSGDPLVIQRAHLLMQSFEKEVQEPVQSHPVAPKPAARRAVPEKKQKKQPAKAAKPARTSAKTAQTSAKSAHSPAKKAAIRTGRAKPAAKKAEVSRKRTRR